MVSSDPLLWDCQAPALGHTLAGSTPAPRSKEPSKRFAVMINQDLGDPMLQLLRTVGGVVLGRGMMTGGGCRACMAPRAAQPTARCALHASLQEGADEDQFMRLVRQPGEKWSYYFL